MKKLSRVKDDILNEPMDRDECINAVETSNDSHTDRYDEERKKQIAKLHKMRGIATGLLVLMAAIFVIFRRFEGRGLLFSSIVAFAEAAMVGALADWFAVTALFRHPLGMRWIPHTAILQRNKGRIGEAISNFVVSNFFTSEAIHSKLIHTSPTEEILTYVRENKVLLAQRAAVGLPAMVQWVLENEKLMQLAKESILRKLEKIQLYPLLGKGLETVVASRQHIPFVKELLANLHQYVTDNKESTLHFVEGLNRTLALPVIGDIVYKNILKSIAKQIEDIDNDPEAGINRMLTYSLPKTIERMKTSPELIEKGESLKEEILSSELFQQLVERGVPYLQEITAAYAINEKEALQQKLEAILEGVLQEAEQMTGLKVRMDAFLSSSLVNVILNYREEIGRLIRDTVNDWKTEDMIDKLEVQVGADLQYIRINGTVVGGLAGLLIHLISHMIYAV